MTEKIPCSPYKLQFHSFVVPTVDIAVESKIRTFFNLFAPLRQVASPKAYHFAIAVYLALQQMIQHYLPVVIFSLEMTKHQME